MRSYQERKTKLDTPLHASIPANRILGTKVTCSRPVSATQWKPVLKTQLKQEQMWGDGLVSK